MDQIFPEFDKLFSSIWRNSSITILQTYLTPENIAEATVDELFSILKDKSHNRITNSKAIEIKEAAADTFGIKIAQSAFSFQLKQLFERLDLLNNQIETLENEIAHFYKKSDCNLHTIPGIGLVAAATCTFHESPLNEYYKKKREQGKHHLTAIGAVSNKLTSIIYAILRDGTPYKAKRFPT